LLLLPQIITVSTSGTAITTFSGSVSTPLTSR